MNTENTELKSSVNEAKSKAGLAASGGSASRDQEIKKLIEGMAIARKAILADLKRRYEAGDKQVKLNGHSQRIDDEGEPSNYHSGAGEIVCPVCESGSLRYSRASYNGHVHAACSHSGCVRWME